MFRGLASGALSLLIAAGVQPQAAGEETVVYATPLRVCADPNNLPYSNKAGEGFENKLADLVATDMGTTVEYTWFPQRRGFLRETLNALECDLVMGVPLIEGLTTTRSYYRSSYVFLTRTDRHIAVDSITAPQLANLTIGVNLIGDDGANTPPAEVLSRLGMVDNVRGYSIYGDYKKPAPTAGLVDAVADGAVDIAAIWGPIGGYFAKQSDVPMTVTPIAGTLDFLPLVFEFPIAMGVRSGDDELKLQLNNFIEEHQDEIDRLLESYGVPLL